MKYNDYDIKEIRKTGSRVRALMNPKKDTVASIANIINVSPSQMSKLLNDQYEWSVDKVFLLAQYFGVKLEYIYFGVNDASFISQFRETMMHIDKLSEEEQRLCYWEIANKLYDKVSQCIDK
jgi:transcriptional regulator with XRE-family HTH domain